jgi:hypothetical protein
LDDAFDLGAMMQTAVEIECRVSSVRYRRRGVGEEVVLAEEVGKGNAAEAPTEAPKKFTASGRIVKPIHRPQSV